MSGGGGGHKESGGISPWGEMVRFGVKAAVEAATEFIDEVIPEMLDKPHGGHH